MLSPAVKPLCALLGHLGCYSAGICKRPASGKSQPQRFILILRKLLGANNPIGFQICILVLSVRFCRQARKSNDSLCKLEVADRNSHICKREVCCCLESRFDPD